ncbi:MAG TPA: F0F1 ATP synthase subunit alpha, partial [Dehalococcoidia bacterium]|nr:F0F1 ATP synthase subunit alpha [Dehalococcoidia bacterium]
SDLDAATRSQLARGQLATEVLKQGQYVPMPLEQEVVILFAVNAGLIEDLALDRVADFEEQLMRYMSSTHPDIVQTIADTGDLTEEIEGRLTQAINDFKGTFAA